MNQNLKIILIALLSLLFIFFRQIQAQELADLSVETIREKSIVELDTTETVEWSPSGEFLAVGGTGGILLFDGNLEIVEHFLPDVFRVFTLNWSPDGSRIATAYGDRLDETQIAILNVFTGNALVIEYPLLATPIEWSPMGSQLAVGVWDDTVLVIDAVSGETISTFQGEDDPANLNSPSSICWLDENQLLAIFGLHIYHFTSFDGKIMQDYFGGTVESTECLAEQQRIVTSTGSVRDLSTGEWSRVAEFFPGVDVGLNPTGEYAAFNIAEGIIQIFSIDNPRLLAEMSGGMGEDNISVGHYNDSIAWHPDGELLAAVGEDNILRIWRVMEE